MRWHISLVTRAIVLFLMALPAATGCAQTTHPVETISSIELRDAQGKNTLVVTICMPRDDRPHPVIIFSHGAYSRADVYLPLAESWASHGYICILPTHADSLIYTKRDDSNDPWAGPQDFGVWGRPTTQGTWKPIWSQRARDLLFLLRNTDLIERAIPSLHGRLDCARIGIGGHSLGAFASMLVCGAVVDIPGVGANQNFADPQLRIAALLLLSPPGRGQQGLRDGSWDKLTVPTMVVTGEYDIGVNGEPPTWREEPYFLSPPGDKYLLFVAGANHNSYFGQHVEQKESSLPLQRKGETDQPLGERIVRETQTVTLAFWNAYLASDPAEKQRLLSDSISRQAPQQWRLKRR
jgi:predicted dienelactone hydrolase